MTPTPARDDSEQPPDRRGDAVGAPSDRGAGLVLIVDDNWDTRELYSLYFRSQGYAVSTAHDGRQGVDLALTLRPDVIVMDLSMPGLDGIAATRKLRRDPRTHRLPILILTGYPARAIQSGALEAGADAFLTKPCLPEDLERQVRRVLDASRAA